MTAGASPARDVDRASLLHHNVLEKHERRGDDG